jgi:photosystem II stability/assembly factor-like uncharacterized protein
LVDAGLLAAYAGPVLFTSRDGDAWTQVTTQGTLPDGTGPQLTTRYDAVYLVLSQRLYRSTDRGATWSPLGSDGPALQSVLPGGRALFATGSGGLWRSDDRGSTWVRVHESGFTAVTARDSTIYVSAFNPATLDRSVDDGRTWTKLASPWPSHTANVLLQTGRGTLFAGTSGIFRSTDAGASWTATGVRGRPLTSLATGRGRAYASMLDGSLWHSAATARFAGPRRSGRR